MFRPLLTAVATACVLLCSQFQAFGNVIVSITGVTGGTSFNWSIDGAIETTETYRNNAQFNVNGGLPYPDVGGFSYISQLGNSGDTIVNPAGFGSRDLPTTGGVSLRVDGGPDLFNVGVEIDIESQFGGRLDFDPIGTFSIPEFDGPSVVAYQGAGRVTLPAGRTFDEVFNDGTQTYIAGPNRSGGNNLVIYNVTTVPEPSIALSLLGLGGLGGIAFATRRRRHAPC